MPTLVPSDPIALLTELSNIVNRLDEAAANGDSYSAELSEATERAHEIIRSLDSC